MIASFAKCVIVCVSGLALPCTRLVLLKGEPLRLQRHSALAIAIRASRRAFMLHEWTRTRYRTRR
jgi:hypothetical protein